MSSNNQIYLPTRSAVKRHQTYYFDDGNVIFLVGDTLFKIHKYFFVRDSEIFRTMFTLPPGEGKIVEGDSDDCPINLSGGGSVTPLDFERLLSLLYPPAFGEYAAHTVDEWSSILHLASLWDFASISRLALRQLEAHPSLTDIDRIVLANRFPAHLLSSASLSDATTQWLLKPYFELCTRPTSLTLAEGEKLGMRTVILLAHAREEVKRLVDAEDAALEMEADTFDDVHYGQREVVRTPAEKRQSVWDLVARIFGLPTRALEGAASSASSGNVRKGVAQTCPKEWWNFGYSVEARRLIQASH